MLPLPRVPTPRPRSGHGARSRPDRRPDVRELAGPTPSDRRHSAILGASWNRITRSPRLPSSAFPPFCSTPHRRRIGQDHGPPRTASRPWNGSAGRRVLPHRLPRHHSHELPHERTCRRPPRPGVRLDVRSGRRGWPPGPVHRLRGMRRRFPPARSVQCSGPTHAAPMEALPYGPGQSARPGARPHARSTPGHPERGSRKGRPGAANHGFPHRPERGSGLVSGWTRGAARSPAPDPSAPSALPPHSPSAPPRHSPSAPFPPLRRPVHPRPSSPRLPLPPAFPPLRLHVFSPDRPPRPSRGPLTPQGPRWLTAVRLCSPPSAAAGRRSTRFATRRLRADNNPAIRTSAP